jgi:hypothetical protein
VGESNNVNPSSEGNTSNGVGTESEQWTQARKTMAERRMAHTPGLEKVAAERVADRHLEEHRWKSPSAPVRDVIAAALADYERKFPNDGRRPA